MPVDVQGIWNVLQPYLPFLLTEAAKESGKKIPAAIGKFWEALAARMARKPAAAEALDDLRAAPEDEDAQGAFRLQVKKLLREDAAFAAQLADLLAAVSGTDYRAQLQGEGAIAQGEGSTAVGAGATYVGRDVNTGGGAIVGENVNTDGGKFTGRDDQSQQVYAPVNGDILAPGAQKVEQHFYGAEQKTDLAALEEAYLTTMVEQAGKLSLEGIDPKAASEAEKRISLGAVYTALLTISPEAHEKLERGEAQGMREARRRSALEELNDHRYLVLLGDPGSGKTTFVNFVAMCLAGERLGDDRVNLKTLTAPLPDDDGDDEDHPQPWLHGALLPVRVILRDFAARGLPEQGRKVTVEHLWDFLVAELTHEGLGDYAPHLRRILREQGGIFLFDGLDEVPEAEARREQIIQVVRQVKTAFPKCRLLVTSRTYAYRRQDWTLDGFEAAVLAPFSRGQILRFVDRWYAHIAQRREMNPEDAQGRAQLLKRAIFASDRLQALAERPLLLTLMASLHAWRGGSLPEKREQLYNDTVDLLLDWWEKRRVVREPDGTVRLMQPSLAEFLNVGKDRIRQLLNELAYEAHAGQPELQGTADIPEERLMNGLLGLSDRPDIKPRRLVEFLRDRAGLLIPRGVGVYTFPHRTFQEYLAACHLTDVGYPDEAARLAREDPNRWREVVLLAGAKATRGGAFALWPLVDALCPHPAENEKADEPDLWGALLAGQAIVENIDGGTLSKANRQKRDRVRDWQVVILNSDLPAVERTLAGRTLAALGDPRFDPAHWHLPADPTLGFLHIPAGPFLMGSDPKKDEQAYDDEQPQHELTLPDYWIAKYPVTVAQWRAFVEATGYDGFDKRTLRDPDNHPVRWVSWYDALAYCDWLDGVLRAVSGQASDDSEEARLFWEAVASGKYRVTLPSEAEWEKAARGGLPPTRPSPRRGEGKGGGRISPWGDDFSPDCANTAETGLGTTSAVGVFPKGASPYGVLDLSGNVWEWTRSLYREYPYDPGDGRENLDAPDNESRALRGGSFDNLQYNARCAVRYWDYPYDGYGIIGFRVCLSPMDSDR